MTRKRLLPAAALLALTIGLAACGAPASAPPGQNGAPAGQGGSGDKIIIGVGGQTLLTYMPTTLAAQLGYYKEEGLDVELQDLQGGSKALTAMIGGSTQVTSGYYEHTIQMQAKNQSIQAFVDMGESSGVALLVAPKNRDTIKSVADLKGKNIGVTSPGSSTDMYVKYLLNKEGLGKDAASVSAIGAGSSAVAAVENSQVDAAVMLEPDITVLNKRVGTPLPMLGDLRTRDQVKALYGSDTWPSSCLYAKTEWLEKNPEKAKKLATAIARTLQWVQTHSGEEIAAQMPEAYAGGDRAQYARVIDELKLTMSKDGKFSEAGVNAVLDTQRVANPEVGDKKIDLSKTYTNEYVS
ncbi:ABC transporter substrate-binding protein [Enemella evansiae]|uniref:ABC transporter substrate-binding protein n=1 Tax=Enemella evansiae TaxID=2016499 RepID=A0A255GCD2_9ACTN|nr:ABC transporter substrate-binding protein [Enemella evansiae]PFG67115.1 NitT/TauT family transport system substrate-binding protein [Propionibacteriaceae bacterium ES.041]OYN98218.1 ABC transporter substrate-binding protein [Enemella evansiae]OYN99314.1 ABC transporter substrate-binding protein [Enemella evansiae]OYO05396.1 ABC transporter substrate-binding protein [Enemella evansiae]OYO10554.1 ABC transporter substrate-binding protein [Enemella evansiae]